MRPLDAVLVTAPDCHLCGHGQDVLRALEMEYALRIREIDWESEEGRARVVEDAVAFPPALYLDGELAGYGRLSERRLRRRLDERASS